MSDSEVFYVLFDEVGEGFVATRFMGTSYTEGGFPVREAVTLCPDYTDHGVVHFTSEGAARNWLAPNGSYDASRATLIRVTAEYTAAAV